MQRVAAEPATQIQTAAQTLLNAIKAMQAEQMLYVQQLVTKLMPKDFRTSMMLSYQKRSEVRAAEGTLLPSCPRPGPRSELLNWWVLRTA